MTPISWIIILIFLFLISQSFQKFFPTLLYLIMLGMIAIAVTIFYAILFFNLYEKDSQIAILIFTLPVLYALGTFLYNIFRKKLSKI